MNRRSAAMQLPCFETTIISAVSCSQIKIEYNRSNFTFYNNNHSNTGSIGWHGPQRVLVPHCRVSKEQIMAYFDENSRVTIATDSIPSGVTPDALYQLGVMYCAGREVELCLITAHKWFNIAAARGNADAKRYRAEISADMTRAEIAKAQKQAREWLSTR
jgi:uncharacterized protein